MIADLSAARLDDGAFDATRTEVLRATGAPLDIDIAESAAFHRRELGVRNAALALAGADRDGRTLVEPRAGVATHAAQQRLLATLQDAGADILPVTVDSMTRNLDFDGAARALAASTDERSTLNGFPVVAHGVDAARRLVLAMDRPIHCRANGTDLRLLAEVALSSGMSGFVSGPMYGTLEYSKDVPLDVSIRNWQYVFRLIGKYAQAGVPVVEDALGFSQSGSYSVPSLMHVGVVLDALLMAGQGVPHILVYAMAQGALAQDIAACRAVRTLAEEYLARLGHADVQVHVASNHWNGAFPRDEAAAYGLIAVNTITAALGGASLVYVKSIEEGLGVPTAEGNAASVRVTKYVLRMCGQQRLGRIDDEVELELELNLLEARAILDAVLDLGAGDPAIGAVRAFEQGVLDVPFSPSVHAKGDVMVARDAGGAVRFLDAGRIPLPARAVKIARARLDERAVRSGRPVGYDDVLDDMLFLGGE